VNNLNKRNTKLIKELREMVIVIPAYEPDEKLVKLVGELKEKCHSKILIVDDGSGEKYTWIFEKAEELGAVVYRYEKNRGKGAALKTAFGIISNWEEAEEIVTADCDGQHLPEDIMKIMNQVRINKSKIILGVRHFTGKVPFRSIFGNKLTSIVFLIAKGKKVTDTQTGLRGFSKDMIPWLCSIEGDRFEYEMNMLLESEDNGYEIKETPINTVYLENNKSSHFNPLKDSVKIYMPFLKFGMSSIISALLDFSLLLLIKLLTSNLFIAVLGARICSGSLNYLINKYYVFSKGKRGNEEICFHKYALLAAVLMFMNYITLNYLCSIGINLVAAKIMTESILYLFSFLVQKKFVFANNNNFEHKHAVQLPSKK
jgi:glycosyltransferase involved in cell wall biosynthesis